VKKSQVSESIDRLRKLWTEVMTSTGVGAFVSAFGPMQRPKPFPKLPGLDDPDKEYRKLKRKRGLRRK
jgi:hypothetical protein